MVKLFFFLVLAAVGVGGCVSVAPEIPTLTIVEKVDLQRYLGRWYEIATIPSSFEKGCVGTTATYGLRDDGEISVLNQCHDQSLTGLLRNAEGRAWVVDEKTNAKLKVMFFWPFRGDYWIIDLAADYTWAVVGHPSREYLWILARAPKMDEDVYRGIVERLRAQHYDVARLVKIEQGNPS